MYNTFVRIPIGEPIRYIACGFFYSVFVSESNKLFCCGSNEHNLLGVNKYLENVSNLICQVVHVEQFDRRVSKVFTGLMHWYVRTLDHRLYYSGQNTATLPSNHFSKQISGGHFVECEHEYIRSGIEISCGRNYSVAYYTNNSRDLFSRGYAQRLANSEDKAKMHSDVIIFYQQ
jgi:alpha-tubulin suppressor-like RCC1 family protein